ncbi:MAG: DUF421 domain-containing protein [Defluviitaleaceae bacterium]|nr:DUF421 domain-containing protein [Defluviitaleaceae bacterium]
MFIKIYQTAIASAIAIIALFALTRIMGKKQMAQLNFFDYVVGISIGSIASEYAVVRSIHLAEGLTALVVFTLFSLIFSFISVKSLRGRKILDGTPIFLIKNGKIVESNLRNAKLTINDLLEECRQKDIFDIGEIEFAILETSGRLSVLPKSQGLCTNVIIDGEIIEENLAAINLNKLWLASQGVVDYKDILLGYVDTAGKLNIHMKDSKT